MSYCRWSSDNWRCDLYCYGSASGFTTHVAANRVVGDTPTEPSLKALADGSIHKDKWLQRHRAVMDFLVGAERAPIGLPHDGKSFDDATLEQFRDRLLMLRAAGYSFPDYVLDDVTAEIAAETETVPVAIAAPPEGR